MPHSLTKQVALPYLALAVGVIALAVSPLFARFSVAAGPVFAYHRMAVAAVVLLPYFVRGQKRSAPIRRASLIFPLAGGLANALDLTTWYLSVHYTRLGVATLLNNMAPLWVALVAFIFFKEKLRGIFWVGLLIALVGAGVVLGNDLLTNPSLNLGNFIGLGSSAFYAAYYLITQRGRAHLSAIQYTYLMTLSAGLLTFAFSLVFGLQMEGFPPATYLAFLASGIVTQSIGFLALGYALGRLPASIVSPTMILQPVFSALLAIPILGETLQTGQWIGGLAVLAGIYLVNLSQQAVSAQQLAEKPSVGD